MIVEEYFDLNGIQHVRRYSDRSVMIAAEDGIEYETAEDLVSIGKVYHETETPVPQDESEAAEILNIILGVS
jgi:metallophosphoesterase superfamily enzyme